MLKKSMIVILIFTLFGVIDLIAKVPQHQIDQLLKEEKKLSKEALGAYLSGKSIDKYLHDMKEINHHIMKMVSNSDVKHIIEYLNLEIDRINLIYDKDSLQRLHQEIAESREYIKIAMENS